MIYAIIITAEAAAASGTEYTPKTALSLGMSSLCIRRPFASPGSAPSPLISARGLLAPVPRHRGEKPQGSNSSALSFESPRGALFETPGLTPINNSVDASANNTRGVPGSEGPSILTAVSGSAFRSTGIGLSIANDTRDGNFSFASSKGPRVSFGGIPDFDESSYDHNDNDNARNRLSFSSAITVGDLRELQEPSAAAGGSFHDPGGGRTLFSSLRSTDTGNSAEDDSMIHESPHKLPRKGPTPEVAMTSNSTRAKVKQAFAMSGLPTTYGADKQQDTFASSSESDPDEKVKIAVLITVFASVHLALTAYRYDICHSRPSILRL